MKITASIAAVFGRILKNLKADPSSRYIHVSKLVHTMPDGTVVMSKGSTYDVGSNAAKRARRAQRVKGRQDTRKVERARQSAYDMAIAAGEQPYIANILGNSAAARAQLQLRS